MDFESVGNIIARSQELKDIYQPAIYRINNEDDKNKFEKLIDANSNIFIYDEIKGQLKELLKSKNPTRKIKPEEYDALISAHLKGQNLFKYGVWVYYPWSGRLVHALDEEEYIYLRTAANRNKITVEEQKILSAKKVGVIGLSVGQSVSVTIAMERSCGELRLADFDTLELNNLNRIRTGIHNLGVQKVVSVAREIAEIDPFLKVVVYTAGITEDNIHGFFTDGGKLDVVIDECDGVDVKILCRIKARELDVPVLMEASDRGTLDVERYDLEPERPIMHGWLQHLKIDFKILKSLKTSEEKLPYILPISGVETVSARMKASMVEIEQTLTTWPQLASAVTLGGAITADTCRRIFLNQFTASGRYFIDMEELVPDTRAKQQTPYAFTAAALTEEGMKEMAEKAIKQVQTTSYSPAASTIEKLVTAAAQAPSAGNNQPWKWHYHEGCLFLFHEKMRSVSFGDFEDIASFVALGASIENLELEAYKENVGSTVTVFPLQGNHKLVAVIQFTEEKNKQHLYQPETLVKYIGERYTNRKMGQRVPLATDKVQQLKDAVSSVPGAVLNIIDTDAGLEEIGEIIGGAEKLRLMQPEGHYEFFEKELRWTEEQSRNTRDGIDLATVDVTPSDIVGLRLMKDPNVVKLLADWKGGKAMEKLAKKAVAAASAIGFITMPQYSAESYLAGGRAVERMWLKATECDIAMQPMLAATLHFARLNHGNGADMTPHLKTEFESLYQRFEVLFPHTKGKGEIFLFRLCIAEHPEVKSYRLPVKEVLSGIKY